MSCDFTEEVSLLVDGELAPHEATRLRVHIEGCAACKQARETFLLLRQELRSYERAPDPNAQSKALAAILGSRTSETSRGRVSAWLGSLTEAFGGRRLRPAYVAALALILIGTALGVRWFVGSNTSPRTHQPGTRASANTNSQPIQAENSDAVDSPTTHQAGTLSSPHPAGVRPKLRGGRENAQVRRDGRRTAPQRREGLSRELPREVARIGETTPQPYSAVAVALYAAGSLRASADDPALRIGHHAERVERLLRSFRNARLTERDSTLDVADARRLSKRLLYNNIALRREAASAGDLPVEGLLDSVEPILLDISNLPNAPSQEAVGSIKERINRRQLVGALQTQGMLASR